MGEGIILGKSRKNPWIAVTAILAILIIIIVFTDLPGTLTGAVVSENTAAENLINYLNTRTSGVDLVSTEDLGGLYMVTVSYKGDKFPLYVTKDGKYFAQAILPITSQTADSSDSQNKQQPQQDIPKSDKPEIELVVMTHCPYGTQAEKGIIPVFEELGSNINAKIRFVHYFMHGDKEEQETYKQVCIREEQSDKYLNYLKCFLEDGDSERCLNEVKIDKAKLSSCMENNAKSYYAEDSGLSQSYGVKGSPTLVINGQQVRSARDSQSFLNTICSAFTEGKAPEECNQELSTQTPSPGFGYSASGTSSGSSAQCG